jgi:hypothetical protein
MVNATNDPTTPASGQAPDPNPPAPPGATLHDDGFTVEVRDGQVLRSETLWNYIADLLEQIARRDRQMEDRKTVEQAKWALVSSRGMTEPDAHRHLQKTARCTRRTLLAVAEEVLAASQPAT